MNTMRITKIPKEQFDQGIEQILKEFGGDVARIRYSFGEDWSFDPAVDFWVLLSDESVEKKDLGELTRAISDRLFDVLELSEIEHFPYYHFRTVSEQKELKDRQWD